YLPDDRDGFLWCEFSLFLDEALKIHAFDEVHRDELRGAVLADIEDANDVLVDDFLRQQQFLFETLKRGGGLRQFCEDGFDRNDACELTVERFVDGTHSAHTKRVDDQIAAG